MINYTYTLNICVPQMQKQQWNSYFWVFDRYGGFLQTLKYSHYSHLEHHSLMSRFVNRNILSTPSCFVRQCKMSIQKYHSRKRCHAKCQKYWVQEFLSMLYFNPCFYLLNLRKNANLYIIKPPSPSSAKECDDAPKGTLFLWFGPILFLQHRSNVMDHRWLLAVG